MTPAQVVAPSLAPITQAVLAAVRTATGRPIGDMAAPPIASLPYGFLTRLNVEWSGSMRNPHEMATVVYQVQCVALDSDGVEWLEHRARVALATPPEVAGWRFIDWEPLGSNGAALDRDVTPPLAYSTPQWRLIAQPLEETP